jgi:hypothetical protein
MHNFAIRYLTILAFVCFLSAHELSAQSKLPSNGTFLRFRHLFTARFYEATL